MNRSKSKSFVSNIIIILTAQIAVKLLGLIYRMVITNINGFGDVGNGYYSAGFQVYTLLLALSSVGIPSAVSKLISEKIAVGNCGGADSIFKTALFIFAGLGTVLSAGMFLLAGPIAKNLLNMAGAEKTIAALSPSVFFVCVSSVLRGYFSGINKMRIMSASQVIEQIFKSGLTVWFVILAKPIYSLIYPAAPLGFELLQLGSISLVFTALNQTLTGALQGVGKVYIPTAALAAGCIVKPVSNIVLIRIPQINISGAVIGSALCRITVFIIEFCSLSKLLCGKVSIKGAVLKPLLCCAVMGAAACAVYNEGLFISNSNFVAVLASVLLSACVYGAGIIKLRVFSGSEISQIPGFEKIYTFFEKKHIRKNNNVIK